MPYLLYDGPSLIDGKPIIVLATGIDSPSTNKKTGPMLQTYILCKDTPPLDALKNEEDHSICGTCKHRNQTCYVTVWQGPRAVWVAYQNMEEKRVLTSSKTRALGAKRHVRLGAYGDPAAVPIEVWDNLLKKATMHTGYTHAWAEDYCEAKLKNICMASVDTEAEYLAASAKGWRTFRILPRKEDRLRTEAPCPASKEAGEKSSCYQCGACNGQKSSGKRDIAIVIHGSKAKINKFNATFGNSEPTPVAAKI